MQLERRVENALRVITAISLTIVLGVILNVVYQNVFAEETNYEQTEVVEGARFVTFYDDGEKLIVKTDAKTVGEALSRAGKILNDGDVVEPGVDSEINADNFFINIHRARPVVVQDGKTTRYLMTASQDIREIAKQAGLTFFDGDKVEYSTNTSFLETGVANVYKIIRNGGRTMTVEEEIAPGERRERDFNLAPGQSEVREIGEVGVKRATYEIEFKDNEEISRKLVSEEVVKEPKERVVAVGASDIERHPLTPSRGAQVFSYTKPDGSVVSRKETYYDLDMSRVMTNCGGGGYYTVRADGVKVDRDGYVIIAANLNYYPRCSLVETSLGPGKVYDTGGFATSAAGPEWFDIATDWTDHNGI